MKQFIWMLCGIFLSGLLLGTLSACGADQFGVTVMTTGGGQAEPEDAASEEHAGSSEKKGSPHMDARPAPPEMVEQVQERTAAYGKALWDALLSGALPDGTSLDWTDPESASENEFALCDLDGDGEEELLLRWTNACTAGTADFVFRYDGQGLSLEFEEFAGVEFYTNGAAKVPWSHNQGWAGRFWPFNLYQYDEETGTYVAIGAVDAWDRSLFEDDEALSAAFPRDVDADGDGLVYYLLTGDWYNNSRVPSDGNLDGRLWGVDPVDGPDMENWLNVYIDQAGLVRLPLQKLTEDNIAALGCPRPDTAYPEPAG